MASGEAITDIDHNLIMTKRLLLDLQSNHIDTAVTKRILSAVTRRGLLLPQEQTLRDNGP